MDRRDLKKIFGPDPHPSLSSITAKAPRTSSTLARCLAAPADISDAAVGLSRVADRHSAHWAGWEALGALGRLRLGLRQLLIGTALHRRRRRRQRDGRGEHRMVVRPASVSSRETIRDDRPAASNEPPQQAAVCRRGIVPLAMREVVRHEPGRSREPLLLIQHQCPPFGPTHALLGGICAAEGQQIRRQWIVRRLPCVRVVRRLKRMAHM